MQNEIKKIFEKLIEIENRIKNIEKNFLNGGDDMNGLRLDQALTLKEASKQLGIAQTTLKQRIQKKQIDKKYYRKTEGGTYLIHSDYIKNK